MLELLEKRSIAYLPMMHKWDRLVAGSINDFRAFKQRTAAFDNVLFDLDGTLVETNYANFLSYKTAIEKVKKTNLCWFFNPKERVTREKISHLVPGLTEDGCAEIISLKEKLFPEVLHETRLNKMVASLLDVYSGKRRILVTNSRKERALMILEWHKIIDKFDVCFYREDIGAGLNKYQSALAGLRIPSDSVVVFENDNNEVENALFAGILSDNIFNGGDLF